MSTKTSRTRGHFRNTRSSLLLAYEATRGVPNPTCKLREKDEVARSDVQTFEARGQVPLGNLQNAFVKVNDFNCIILIISLLQVCKRYIENNNNSLVLEIYKTGSYKNIHVQN